LGYLVYKKLVFVAGFVYIIPNFSSSY